HDRLRLRLPDLPRHAATRPGSPAVPGPACGGPGPARRERQHRIAPRQPGPAGLDNRAGGPLHSAYPHRGGMGQGPEGLTGGRAASGSLLATGVKVPSHRVTGGMPAVERAMSFAEEMIRTNPNRPATDPGALAACIKACVACAQACTACADACLGEQDIAVLA